MMYVYAGIALVFALFLLACAFGALIHRTSGVLRVVHDEPRRGDAEFGGDTP